MASFKRLTHPNPCIPACKMALLVVAMTALLSACATPVPHTASASAAKTGRPTCAPPNYPAQAVREMRQGTVTLSFLIGADGAVKARDIVKSSGWPDLDIAARDALSKCPFKPAMVEGKPVEARTAVQYVWSIR